MRVKLKARGPNPAHHIILRGHNKTQFYILKKVGFFTIKPHTSAKVMIYNMLGILFYFIYIEVVILPSLQFYKTCREKKSF